MSEETQTQKLAGSDARAEAFVTARRSGAGIDVYPGELPASLDEAYAIQDAAIALWPTAIAGWKVGRITGEHETKLGHDRLVGPVFEEFVHRNSGDVLELPVYVDGFAAVEGEVTAVISKDVPAGKTDFTTEDALEYIGALHFGVELASSPFKGINDFGPLVTISDFGNNRGLVLGREIADWRDMNLSDWTFETFVNEQSVGRATPAGIPGGPVESVRYLLENTAKRGLPLKAGMMVLTGAVTGVHEAFAGDSASVTLAGEEISLRLTEA